MNQKNKPFIKEAFYVVAAMFTAVLVFTPAFASAAGFFDVPKNLCDYFPCPGGADGTGIAKSLVGKIIDNVRYLIGTVAVVMIVISGVRLITASGNEETFTKASSTLLYAVIGLIVVALAGELAMILEVDRGGFLKDPNVALQKSRLFSRTLTIIITFIKYIIGGIAVAYLMRSALRLVLLGGNDDEVTKDKQNISYALLGLVMIMIANPIITKIFFKIDTTQYPGIEPVRPGIDPVRLTQELVGVTNLIALIAGPAALLSLVVGAVMYVFSAGEEEQTGKAKKIITWSLIGLVLIYGGFAIVSTVVSRQFEGL